MAWWKQLGLVLVLVAGASLAWAFYVPSAAPILARLGLPVPERAAEAEGDGPGGFGRGGATAVIARPVALDEADGRISAIGDGRSIRSVAVTPLVAGRVVEVPVVSGQPVEAGEPLALLDDDAEEIGVERARLAVEDAEATLARFEQLRSTGATTDVQVREARLAVDQARLELRDAELELERRRVEAPFSGVVGILPVEPGQQVTTSTEIATVDDRSRILVDFRVPERWVGEVEVGDPVEAVALARPDLELGGVVHAVDNRIDPTSRTLRVQALIENEADMLRAGMAFRIGMSFRGESYPAVDPLALQWSSEGAYVWGVRDGRAARVPVRIVQRWSDRVLVVGELAPGDLVVTEGLQRLREGDAVDVRPEGGEAPAREGAGLGLSRASPPTSRT
jgi:RND family efflux transporter MFP subunit